MAARTPVTSAVKAARFGGGDPSTLAGSPRVAGYRRAGRRPVNAAGAAVVPYRELMNVEAAGPQAG